MKTIALEMDANADPHETVKKARAKLQGLADKLPPAMKAKLEASMDEALDEALEGFLRDGPGVTTAKSLITIMKDACETLKAVPHGLLALPPHIKENLSRSSALASAFVLGGIAADVVSAAQLIEDAHKRLRDHLDTECFAPGSSSKKPESKPKEQPAAG